MPYAHQGKVAKKAMKTIRSSKYCAISENIHTLSIEGIGTSQGGGVSGRPNYSKKCMDLDWHF